MKKLPFEITLQIKRYLRELLVFHEQFCVKTDRTLILHTYTNKEIPTEKNDNNILDFFEYLFEIGALEDAGNSEFKKLTEEKSGLEGGFDYVASYTVKILDIKPIRKLLKKIEIVSKKEIEKLDVSNKNDTKRLILMNGEGNFTKGKDKDPIRFKNTKADYYKVFVAIYKITNGVGGSVTYKEISAYIKSYLEGKKDLDAKCIQNHINNSLRRRYIGRYTPDGEGILSADYTGKKVIFYNPVI